MQLFHKYHVHKMYELFHTKFWLFEASIWLHVFGRSMISIFIPIFLLNIGYSISNVMLYYVLFNAIDLPFNFVAKWLIQKIGARAVIILGTFSFIVFFIMLYNLELGNWLLFAAMAFFMAVYDSFFWVGHLYLFMLCLKHKRNASEETSFLYIVKRIASILAPFFGAFILIFFQRNVLIVVSTIILFLSTWPLFKIEGLVDKPKAGEVLPMKKFFSCLHDIKAFFLYGIFSFHNVAENVIWPIFIFIVFNSIKSVAIIPVLISITAMIFAYFTGRIKKSSRWKVMSIAAVLIAITWVLRLVLHIDAFYFISVILVGFFSILITIPLDSEIFEKGEKKDPLSASTYRNAISMAPRIFFYAALFTLLEVFKVSFLSAAIAMFLIAVVNYLFVIKKSPKVFKEM